MVAPAPVLPTTRDENWKHAPLRGIERLQWAPPTALTQEALLAALPFVSIITLFWGQSLTASYLVSTLRSRNPASVEICALLDKTVRRIAPLQVRYAGFDCPDRFVIGDGMDHRQRFRTLRSIYALETEGSVDEALLLKVDREA